MNNKQRLICGLVFCCIGAVIFAGNTAFADFVWNLAGGYCMYIAGINAGRIARLTDTLASLRKHQ